MHENENLEKEIEMQDQKEVCRMYKHNGNNLRWSISVYYSKVTAVLQITISCNIPIRIPWAFSLIWIEW